MARKLVIYVGRRTSDTLIHHTHLNKPDLDKVSGTNTGDQDLSGLLRSIIAGDNVSVDNTDPQNPVVSSINDLPEHELTFNHEDIDHTNRSVLDALSDTGGELYYEGGRVVFSDELEYTRKTSCNLDAVLLSQFDTSVEGWIGLGAILSLAPPSSILLTPTQANAGVYQNGLSINGAIYSVIRVAITRIAGSGWDGSLFYSTALHGYTTSYRKSLANPALAIGDSTVLEFSMSSLTAGGTDWLDSIITGLRLDLGNTSTDIFSIDYIAVGRLAPTAIAQSGEAAEPLLEAHIATISHIPGTLRRLRSSLCNPLEQLTGLVFVGDSITWGRTLTAGAAYDPRTGYPTDPRDNSTSGSFVNLLRSYIGEHYYGDTSSTVSNWPDSPSGESITEYVKELLLFTALAPFSVNDIGSGRSSGTIDSPNSILGYRHYLNEAATASVDGYVELEFNFTGTSLTLLYTSISLAANADYELFINGVSEGVYSTWSGAAENNVERLHTFPYVREAIITIRLVRNAAEGIQYLYFDAIKIAKTLRVYNQGIIGATSYSYLERCFGALGNASIAVEEMNHAIVQIGTNDRASSFNTHGQSNGLLNFRSNLNLLLDELALTTSTISLMCANPATTDGPPTYSLYMNDIRGVIREVATARNHDFIDNYAIFSSYDLADVLADGLHPNELGHELYFRNILAALEAQQQDTMVQHLLDYTHGDIAHSNRTSLDLVSGTNTGDQDLSGYSLTSHTHLGLMTNDQEAAFDVATTASATNPVATMQDLTNSTGSLQSALDAKVNAQSGVILGQSDALTPYTPASGDTITHDYSLGGAYIDCSDFASGGSVIVTVTNWPSATTRMGGCFIVIKTGANVPVPAYTGFSGTAPILEPSTENHIALLSSTAGSTVTVKGG